MSYFNQIVITTLAIFLCLGQCRALRSSDGGGSQKFGLFMVRSPETIIAPIGDEVVFECATSVPPDSITWRFLPQSALKDPRRRFVQILGNRVRETAALPLECPPSTN